MKNPVPRYTSPILLAAAFALFTACTHTKPVVPPPEVVPPEPAPVLVEPPRPEVKTEPAPLPPPQEPQQTELYRLLVQSEGVRRMAAGDAAKELEQARQSFARAKTDYNRLLYALLLLLPNTGGADDARAAALLEPMVKEKGSTGNGMRALAAFAYFQIGDNRKLEERMREEQKRADSLQEKLDALKEVEKSLIDREQSSPHKK